jgi:iron(II)-dependent oxidoreductase
MSENETQSAPEKNIPAKCIICGGLILGVEKVCPLCRTAAKASKAGSETDDTEDLDIAQLQKTDHIYVIETGMPLVYIPPGEFSMGSDGDGENEKPAHHAYLDAFFIGRFPVTNWQYHEYVRDSGQKIPPYMQKLSYNEPDKPIVGVSWHDALDFCKWFGRKAKKNYSLPTEAQWEKAARGAEGNRYPWGNEKPSPDKAHYHKAIKSGPPAEVTAHLAGASPYGCQDMVGNIWEWTADPYDTAFYARSEYENPVGPSGSGEKVLRGGGRTGRGDFLRCTRRIGADPGASTNQTGFRIARAIEKNESLPGGAVRRKHEARVAVRQAKKAIRQNRKHQASTLLRKALEFNPNNKAAERLLKSMPHLPEGLEPAKNTTYHPETGLPLEVFCEWTGSTMALVPAGKFLMGSNKGPENENPAHEVYLDSFYIDKFEVTNEMFAQFLDMQGIQDAKETLTIFEQHKHGVVMRSGRWMPAPNYIKHPVVCITWRGAQMYAEWAGMALPTEAQWEKAARGTDSRIYPWGNKFTAQNCNCKQSGLGHTTPVNNYPNGLSPFGCWDMAGNVWEWCFDWYAPDYYSSSPNSEPLGPPSGEMKILRSGGWGADAAAMHCSARYFAPPEIHLENLGGFRCVKLLTPRPPREEFKRSLAKKITGVLQKPIIGGKKPDTK